MSIYASMGAPNDDHEVYCDKYVEVEPDSFELHDENECTCGLPDAPIIYNGSHILPSMDDERGGDIDVAMIPAHVQREGQEYGEEGEKKPFLRLGIFSYPSKDGYPEGGNATVVLDLRGVENLRHTLSVWLKEMEEENE